FLSKFAPDGKTLLFSTRFGSSQGLSEETPAGDALIGMAIGSDGTVYLAGYTQSQDFPYTINPSGPQIVSSGYGGSLEMFAMAIDPALTKLTYSVHLGEGNTLCMALSPSGNLYVSGTSVVSLMPLKSPINGMVRRRSLEVVDCGARRHLMKIYALGIDLGKTVFHLVGLDASGQMVVRKRCSGTQLLAFTANLQVQLIGMEACSGSHFLGRALRAQGHEVRLMPAQYVKPYVKTNKSDYIDAEAIAEAVTMPNMRFVPIKSDDQLDLQSLHRVRERWVMRRTAVINQIRGLLLERGITLRQGRRHIDAALPGILEDASAQLSGALRLLLAQLRLELDHLQMRIDEADAVINKIAGDNDACRRLVAIPGIGPVTATAIIAAIGNGAAFK